MAEGANTYRDELAAAQARIATLEAKILAARDEDTTAKWFAELRKERATVGALGRRFWGLGPDGLGALVVAALLLGAGALFGVLQGALVPALAVLGLGGLFVMMMAFALRSGRKAHFAREVRRVEERIEDANRAVTLAREERQRVVVEAPEIAAGNRLAMPPAEEDAMADVEPAVLRQLGRP
jgi:uncharacterized membrane protein